MMGRYVHRVRAAISLGASSIAIAAVVAVTAAALVPAQARGRVEQNVQDVPLSVSAISREMLERRGIMEIPDTVFIPGTDTTVSLRGATLLPGGSPNAQASSFNDYGGGEDFSTHLYNFDPMYGHGGLQNGVFTSNFQPYTFTFAGGEGIIKVFGSSNNSLVNYDNNNPAADETFIGTSAATPTQFGIRAGVVLDSGLIFGGNFAVSYAHNKLDVQRDNDSLDAGCESDDLDQELCISAADAFAAYSGLGKVYGGLGETAYAGLYNMTYGGIAHVTNADPNLRTGEHEVFGLSNVYGWFVPDVTGVQQAVRVKVATSPISGFIFSASAGNPNNVGAGFDAGDSYWDAALRYAGEFGAFRVAAGAGYQDFDRDTPGYSQQNLTGVITVLHNPTGFFGTVNITRTERDSPMALGAGETDSASNIYAHAGLKRTWFGIGQTTIYGEYGVTNDGESSASGHYVDGAKSVNVGVGLVQNFDMYGVSGYMTYNNVSAERNGIKAQDIDLFQFGVRTQY